MADDALIVIDAFGSAAAFTSAELRRARERAATLGFAGRTDAGSAHERERLVDAERLADLTALPKGWLEEAARQNRIPSITAGKYRRFRASDVIEALREESER